MTFDTTVPFDPDQIQEPLLRKLYDYWLSKHDGDRLPRRADLDPADMRDLLPHLIMVDTAEVRDEFRFRLYGTEVCRGFEQDRTNLTFADRTDIENRDDVYAGYWETYKHAVPVYFHGRLVSSKKDWLLYSRITLPLSADGVRVDIVLAGVVFYTRKVGVRWPGRRGM